MKTRHAAALAVFLLLISAGSFARPPLNQAKESDIRRLMELTGTTGMGEELRRSILEQMQPALEQMFPAGERRDQMIAALKQKVDRLFQSEEVIRRVIPIYDKHLTHEDIRGLIQFYQTPLGERVRKALPNILQESQAVAAEWGEEIFDGLIRELEEEFPELKEIEPPPA